jgi:hypothetical protein
MGYIGNLNGPKKSDILKELGCDYFGISDAELKIDIQLNKDEEFYDKVIDPVRLDELGKPYIYFYGPGKTLQRFYLEEHGYKLQGKVKAIINDEEKEIIL